MLQGGSGAVRRTATDNIVDDEVEPPKPTNIFEEVILSDDGVRSQRVRKTVQPYMHMVLPKQQSKKKVESTETDVSKQYINPMNLKRQQIKIESKSDGDENRTKLSPNSILNHFHSIGTSRTKQRINYCEDLDDEALMYSSMSLNKNKKPAKPQPEAERKQAIDAAMKMLGNEITLVPFSSKKSTSTSSSNNNNSIGINKKLSQSTLSLNDCSNIQISEIKSLSTKKTFGDKSQQKTCGLCKVICADIKQLAIHNMNHMSVAVPKLDEINVLNASHRRVSYLIFFLFSHSKFYFHLFAIVSGSNGHHARWQVHPLFELLEIVYEQYAFGRSLESWSMHALLCHLW